MDNYGFHEHYKGKYPVIEYVLNMDLEDYKIADHIAQKILSKPENEEVKVGIMYSFLVKNGKEEGIFTVYSTLLHPAEETRSKVSHIIKEIGDSINSTLRESINMDQKPLLRTLSHEPRERNVFEVPH